MIRHAALLLTLASAAPAALAYQAPTHAGLVERAALASSLHERLIDRLGRSLGLFEPLVVRRADDQGELDRRLARLDPEGGYAPDDRKQSALAWLVAGSVLEGVPPDRMRNHFYDPIGERGLDEAGAQSLRTRLQAAASGVGSVRGIFTGVSFDGTGSPAPLWALAPRALNDWGLRRFLDERERAGGARTRAERDDALARALLAAGHLLRVIAEMGDPAHVRNDYRVAFEQQHDPYGRFVVERYGRSGVPGPGEVTQKATHLVDLITGLARSTARRFFSPGTLPGSGRFDAPQAEASDASGYVSGAVRHLAAYRRPDPQSTGGTLWRLDDACYADYAAALLPEIARHGRAALELLFRGRLELVAGERLTATAREQALGAGTLTLYADDAKGVRTPLASKQIASAAEGDELGSVALPAAARHAAAVFRGVDSAGEPMVVVEELSLKPRSE